MQSSAGSVDPDVVLKALFGKELVSSWKEKLEATEGEEHAQWESFYEALTARASTLDGLVRDRPLLQGAICEAIARLFGEHKNLIKGVVADAGRNPAFGTQVCTLSTSVVGAREALEHLIVLDCLVDPACLPLFDAVGAEGTSLREAFSRYLFTQLVMKSTNHSQCARKQGYLDMRVSQEGSRLNLGENVVCFRGATPEEIESSGLLLSPEESEETFDLYFKAAIGGLEGNAFFRVRITTMLLAFGSDGWPYYPVSVAGATDPIGYEVALLSNNISAEAESGAQAILAQCEAILIKERESERWRQNALPASVRLAYAVLPVAAGVVETWAEAQGGYDQVKVAALLDAAADPKDPSVTAAMLFDAARNRRGERDQARVEVLFEACKDETGDYVKARVEVLFEACKDELGVYVEARVAALFEACKDELGVYVEARVEALFEACKGVSDSVCTRYASIARIEHTRYASIARIEQHIDRLRGRSSEGAGLDEEDAQAAAQWGGAAQGNGEGGGAAAAASVHDAGRRPFDSDADAQTAQAKSMIRPLLLVLEQRLGQLKVKEAPIVLHSEAVEQAVAQALVSWVVHFQAPLDKATGSQLGEEAMQGVLFQSLSARLDTSACALDATSAAGIDSDPSERERAHAFEAHAGAPATPDVDPKWKWYDFIQAWSEKDDPLAALKGHALLNALEDADAMYWAQEATPDAPPWEACLASVFDNQGLRSLFALHRGSVRRGLTNIDKAITELQKVYTHYPVSQGAQAGLFRPVPTLTTREGCAAWFDSECGQGFLGACRDDPYSTPSPL